MAKRITAAAWKVFLRTLARTGNVRTSAAASGMDCGTAYDRRVRDPAFAGKWAAALDKARSQRPRDGRKDKGAELIVRKTKLGTKLVRAAPGRWCAQTEEAFFAALGRTACVRSAAAAAGLSTTALYRRRDNYPDFAERWARIEAQAAEELPGLLRAASIASLDPEVSDKRLPKVNVDQAIRISRMKATGGGDRTRGRLICPRAVTEAETDEAILKSLKAVKGRLEARLLDEGWSRTADGRMIPPGWSYTGPADGEWAPSGGLARD